MQIILLSSRFSTAKTIHLDFRHIVAVLGFFLIAVLCGSTVLSWLSIHWRLPIVQAQIEAMQTQELQESEQRAKSKLQALASRLGELQAQITRLDGLGQRLSTRAGLPAPQTLPASIPPETAAQIPSQGGPFVPVHFDEKALDKELTALASQVEAQSLHFSSLEAILRESMVRREFLPTSLPVTGDARLGSPFGRRNDPFGRGLAMHEGLDFVAPYGTPILAAAGGVVVNAAFHSEFGNMVEINHGGELITRYAHMSARSVSVGDTVRRGQKIGELGTTGRSTGPHLHFEVRQNSLPLDPATFLSVRVARQ
ncbi:MAG: M23 family metallopeptidase [Zoogloeaceae bacterium]|jgi:murein DD-endopeptidase MepM/ murein hydrolase activator NlpD|nr:M23 family metallopeptidase [Zoogloeaceae bacterium]